MLFEHGTCAPASPLGVSRELLRKEVKVTIKFAIITCSDTRTLETDEAGHAWLLTKNGGRLLYDDGKMKSHAELLENADIDVAMCGHAHGGQMRIPGVGGLYTKDQGWFPKLTEGVQQINGISVVISRGLGDSSEIP